MNTENISETTPNRPGRPTRFLPEVYSVINGLYHCRTRRSLMNAMYLQNAFRALSEGHTVVDGKPWPDEFDWLWSDGRLRSTILYALGATYFSNEAIRSVARDICENKAKTVVAVQFVRNCARYAEEEAAAEQADE